MSDKRVIESVVRRALEVQEIYLEHKEADLPDTYIYRKYIRPRFHISIRTFRRYLGRNARREIKQFQSNDDQATTTTTD